MKKFLFVGNRYYVLKKMLELGCEVTQIYAVKDSYLEHVVKKNNIPYRVLTTKNEFINELLEAEFDILISNGCPYILPVSKFENTKKFINIHPSLLPDLKGKHPINGALLFGRRHGVTCHYMSDLIDEGKIISQIEIPITDDIDLELLYQISFISEGDCFEMAWRKDFIQTDSINVIENPIYYTRKQEDMMIKLGMPVSDILNVVRAFNSNGQYAKVIHNGKTYNIFDAKEIKNVYINKMYKDMDNNMVLDSFGKKSLVKINETILQFVFETEMETSGKFMD